MMSCWWPVAACVALVPLCPTAGAVRFAVNPGDAPLDGGLPGFAEVGAVSVFSDGSPDVAVAWTRRVDPGRLAWDASNKVWRVRGTDLALSPGSGAPLWVPGPRGQGGRFLEPPPDEERAVPKGSYIFTTVLRAGRLDSTRAVPEIGAESGSPTDLLGGITRAEGSWHLAVVLRPLAGSGPNGVALVSFDSARASAPRVLSTGLAPGGRVLLAHDGRGRLHGFWSEFYWPPRSLPDFMGGRERTRVCSVRIDGGQASEMRIVYDTSELISGVAIAPRSGELDLVVKEDDVQLHETKVELVHVAATAGPGKPRHQRICTCSSRTEYAVYSETDRLAVLSLEEQEGRMRLIERRFQEGRWSQPAVLAEGTGWDCESMAAAGFRRGTERWAAVVWRDEGANLMYCVRSPGTGWSAPQEAPAKLGHRNWLNECGDELLLLTNRDGNVWPYLIRVTD